MQSDQPETRETAKPGKAARAWASTLVDQAQVELTRAVYGLEDCAHGRTSTSVAVSVRKAQEQGATLTPERALQRARAYLPVAGHEHCPRCWVLAGIKHVLHVHAEAELPSVQTARCTHCTAEYVSTL